MTVQHRESAAGTVGVAAGVNAPRRLNVLADHDFAALNSDGALQRLTDFAAALCEAPIALISVGDDDEQLVVAGTGLKAQATERGGSFPIFSMMQPGIIEVPDALLDPRFADHTLVKDEPHIRFYASAPVATSDGHRLGVLYVAAPQPRSGLTDVQRQGLTVLAEQVAQALQSNRIAKAQTSADSDVRRILNESDGRFTGLVDAMPQMVWSARADGFPDYYSERWYQFTGTSVGDTDGDAWSSVLHPDDRENAIAVWTRSAATGEPYEIEYRLRRADGTYRWALGRALPQRDENGAIIRWFGTCTDIHEQRLALEEREIISQELSHRIKNIFAVVIGLVGVAARSKPELASLASELRERIAALGRAHDYVRPHSALSRPTSVDSSLQGLLTTLFAPYQTEENPRLIINGDDSDIDDRSATPLALLFHELATNAMKYGALANSNGTITVSITAKSDIVRIEWREEGGPAIHNVAAIEGFGSRLIEMSLVRQLGGTIDRNWLATGLIVVAEIPASSMRR